LSFEIKETKEVNIIRQILILTFLLQAFLGSLVFVIIVEEVEINEVWRTFFGIFFVLMFLWVGLAKDYLLFREKA